MELLILLMLFAVIILAVGVLVLIILKKVERFSRSLFGTKSLADGLRMQAEELAETPKSVSGMTRIYEPQLRKDFPEFNWKEFRDRAEQTLITALAAVSEKQPELVKDGSEELRSQVENRIRENERHQIAERFYQVQVHNTEIARYERKKGTCVLTLQSAVGHIHYKEKDGKLIEGNRERPVQTKYNIQLMYIQDAEAANLDKAVGAACPHCGAPIVSLGEKKCEYCGLAVTLVNIQVWSITGYYEVDYHRV